jgi:hypothetical protein
MRGRSDWSMAVLVSISLVPTFIVVARQST